MYLVGVPLLIVPFALYNIFVFIIPGASWSAPFASVTLRSGAQWPITPGDCLITFAILILLVELVKLTRLGLRSWVDHILSFALFAGMTAEFVMVHAAATPTFFLLVVIGFVDFVGGIFSALAARARRRQLIIEQTPPPPVRGGAPAPTSAVAAEPEQRVPIERVVKSEPKFEPKPEPKIESTTVPSEPNPS